MSLTRARAFIVATFLAGLVLQLLAVSLTYVRSEIGAKDLLDLIIKLLSVYSVPLAVILGGVFGDLKTAGRASRLPFWLAFILSLLWNLLLLWRSIAFFLATDDRASRLLGYLDAVSAASSFLVAGALAYFFTAKKTK